MMDYANMSAIPAPNAFPVEYIVRFHELYHSLIRKKDYQIELSWLYDKI